MFIIIETMPSGHLECLGRYSTKELAEARIEELGRERVESWGKRRAYIKGYVDGIQLPEGSHLDWMAFVDLFSNVVDLGVDRVRFRTKLREALINDQHATLEGYDPPAVHWGPRILSAVEVPQENKL